MRTGIIYTRVSSDEQVKGTSLREQEEFCLKYCAEKDIDVLKVFCEEGASAKSADRPMFLSAIEYCRKNKVDTFVVWKCDRFARNMSDHYAVKSTLLKYGTKLNSVTESIGDDPTGKLMEGVMAIFGEFDNDIRKMRCSGGMLGRLKQGITPWKPPVGYICQHNKKQDKKKDTPDPIDPATFYILQRGLREYTSGCYTITQLAEVFNRYGLTTSKGKKINAKFVDRLLTEHLAFYAGILKNPFYPKNGEMTYEGKHTPMITKAEYGAILMIRAGKKIRSVKHAKTNNGNFPLKGTIFCEECGKKITGSSPRGNGGVYHFYYCSNQECVMRGKTIRKKEVEEGFLKFLSSVTPQERILKLFEETVISYWKEKGLAFEIQANRFDKELATLNAKKKRIKLMREDGEYSKEEYQERIDEVENQILALGISLNEANIEKFDVEAVVRYAVQTINDLPRFWFDLSEELRPRFGKMVFPEGVLYSKVKSFRTTKIGCIYELKKKNSNKKSPFFSMVDPSGFEPLTSSLQMRRSTN